MVEAFDRVELWVPDLASALASYTVLLGVDAAACRRSARSAWLGLPNTLIEMVEGSVEQAEIRGLVLAGPGGCARPRPLPNPLALELALCDGSETSRFRGVEPRALSSSLRVDHLVLRSNDAQACITLFAEQLGIRLALDRTVPAWGGRMLFFRAGSMTLEVIESGSPAANHFWGIAYRCDDIETETSRLRRQGVVLSRIREGRKPGTRVATIQSHCLDIPTLLIGPT